jgi:hypothetical protein
MTAHLGRWIQLIAFTATLAALPEVAAAATSVFYCGQTFRGRGELVTNLDCTGFGGSAVTIERGRLNLNGFSITNAGQYGVHCLNSCQIVGPGLIQAHGLDGVRTEGWVGVRNVMISGNTLDGVNARNFSSASRVVASDAVITNNGFNGIESDSAAMLRRTTVTGNLEHGVDVGIFDCSTAGRLLLFRSTVTANAAGCSASPVCADLTSCGNNDRAPRLRSESVCQTSYVRGSGDPGQSWDVCSQD